MDNLANSSDEAVLWRQTKVDLAARSLGGDVLSASDDFFAEKDNLLLASEPIFLPEKYTAYGKWMDGWESRRRRNGDHDWVIVRLATLGMVEGVEVDTRHFKGNAPGAVRLDYIASESDPDEHSDWQPMTEQLPVDADARNLIHLDKPVEATHIRLRIFPDGGVARLRVYGKILFNTQHFLPNEPIDLTALMNGARPVSCSDAFFSPMQNLLRPGRGADMHDGWETKRRRNGGHDWMIIRLATPGSIGRVEIDTLHFKGNYPDRGSLEGCYCESEQPDEHVQWQTILPEQKLYAHRNHSFVEKLQNTQQAYTHVRLNIYPDGGVSRLRVVGQPEQTK
ncbi:allantoicase [Endozoicomonas arenosclerae]|uniref:allantoicase n=1 Tax=Endozoicomonas arenosclerae TaxID=1633495 RepID=UPI000781DE9D|nr:allantoicase [Endozoicomonas arenosclerae]